MMTGQWNPLRRWQAWRARHSAAYERTMAGYWSGNVCRFCDRNYAEQRWCDIAGRPCDFHLGRR